jgi:hypothetical protein
MPAATPPLAAASLHAQTTCAPRSSSTTARYGFEEREELEEPEESEESEESEEFEGLDADCGCVTVRASSLKYGRCSASQSSRAAVCGREASGTRVTALGRVTTATEDGSRFGVADRDDDRSDVAGDDTGKSGSDRG